MKHRSSGSNNLCPSYLILYWSQSDCNMNILPSSISRTGSCLHKEVNYDTNNNVPGRDVGGSGDKGVRKTRKGARTAGYGKACERERSKY